MTHTATHTPGPWVAHHSGIGDATVVAECGWVNKDGTPFNPTIVSRIDWPTAHLIAAAPAMYEALREAQELIRSLVAEEMIHSSELQRVGNCQANMWEALAQADGVGHE